jgi:tetratricopeptide (TPR) repeat protein
MAATVRWAHGQWSYAREESLQSERVVRSGKDEDHIVGMAETAKCLAMIERDLSKADAMLMEAQALSARNGFNYYAIPAGLGLLRYYEGKLDEAEELLKDARALCKSAGNRIDEFQANEYLMMIEFQRGRYEQAKAYCETLESIGEKLRVGSEGPFAAALSALCEYALQDETEALESALEALRVVDAKHRLAYTLTRAAQLDCERGRLDDAARRAAEALDYATLLQRATEMATARGILACTCRASGDPESAAEHEAALAELEAAGVAAWATVNLRPDSDDRMGTQQ